MCKPTDQAIITIQLTNAKIDMTVREFFLIASVALETCPIFDTEKPYVGDPSLLPSGIRVSEPVAPPTSATIDFWDEWSCRNVLYAFGQEQLRHTRSIKSAADLMH